MTTLQGWNQWGPHLFCQRHGDVWVRPPVVLNIKTRKSLTLYKSSIWFVFNVFLVSCSFTFIKATSWSWEMRTRGASKIILIQSLSPNFRGWNSSFLFWDLHFSLPMKTLVLHHFLLYRAVHLGSSLQFFGLFVSPPPSILGGAIEIGDPASSINKNPPAHAKMHSGCKPIFLLKIPVHFLFLQHRQESPAS